MVQFLGAELFSEPFPVADAGGAESFVARDGQRRWSVGYFRGFWDVQLATGSGPYRPAFQFVK